MINLQIYQKFNIKENIVSLPGGVMVRAKDFKDVLPCFNTFFTHSIAEKAGKSPSLTRLERFRSQRFHISREVIGLSDHRMRFD